MMSSSTNGKRLSLDEPITKIKFMMKHESMLDQLPNEVVQILSANWCNPAAKGQLDV
jgi:hypothetical protein